MSSLRANTVVPPSKASASTLFPLPSIFPSGLNGAPRNPHLNCCNSLLTGLLCCHTLWWVLNPETKVILPKWKSGKLTPLLKILLTSFRVNKTLLVAWRPDGAWSHHFSEPPSSSLLGSLGPSHTGLLLLWEHTRHAPTSTPLHCLCLLSQSYLPQLSAELTHPPPSKLSSNVCNPVRSFPFK